MRRILLAALLLFAALSFSRSCPAQYDPQAAEPIGKFPGTLVIHGGGELPEAITERFLALAGGAEAHLVIVPTAGEPADDGRPPASESLWTGKAASVTVLHTRDRAVADSPDFCALLGTATGVWFEGGQQSRIAEAYVGTAFERALHEVLARGGVVGGTSAGAAVMSRTMITGGNPVAEVGQGFDLLPGAVIDQHFTERDRQPRLLGVLKDHPGLVGYGIDEGTALVAGGRSLEVLGAGGVTLCLAASPTRPERVERWTAGERRDHIALSRAALARAAGSFPPAQPAAPCVAAGSLIIIGGGGMPEGLLERFVELSGGSEAGIVFVPCTEEETLPGEPGFCQALRAAGANNVVWIHTKDRHRANEDEQILAPLRTAGGIWFDGGRQWNLVDSYQNTVAHRLMHEVLARGGCVGGSSAGASIQGDFMPRGDPLGNLNIIAEGYEQGLGLLTGVAIDQHFAQRNRFADMTSLVAVYPQLLGIGLDEGTAIVVAGSIAEVVGGSQVHFYDAARPMSEDESDHASLSAGQKYDLRARATLESD